MSIGSDIATNTDQQQDSSFRTTDTNNTSIKCVFVGDNVADKTNLLVTYTTGAFPLIYQPTVFTNYAYTVRIGNVPYSLGLFDTSGREDYDRLRPLSYEQTDLFIVCYSVVAPSSFYNVRDKWVPEIREYCPNTPFILVGTQIDMRDDRRLSNNSNNVVSFDDGKKLAKMLKAVNCVECSALTQVFNYI